jgi:DNA modification methylase
MTELIWDGKYKDGKKQGPVRIPLPFQTIETVNESARERQRSLELFSAGREPEWRNRLIWGDKKYVLPSLLPEFAGKINLIYIDPPFDTGQDFSFTAAVPNCPETTENDITEFIKEPSMLEQKAYRDTWGVSAEERQRGISSLDRYLKWSSEALVFLRELLAEDGSIYVHLDWHIGHYAKLVLDELFGQDLFVNEIVWAYKTGGIPERIGFSKKHDTLLLYAKGENPTFNELQQKSYVKTLPEPHTESGKGLGVMRDKVCELCEVGLPGQKYRMVRMRDVWDDVGTLFRNDEERVNFDTQKPEKLLERIIRASSKEGGLVLDCFVGSGTTAVVAEKLNRRWLACDLSRFAIHTTRKRLLGIPSVKPFIVQNLGKYERQAWQVAEFPTNGKDRLEEQREREAAYRNFILDLYHAKPVSGATWLHGMKAGRMVHVGAVDAPVTLADAKAIARETWKAVGTGKDAPAKAGVDILGWEFAFEVNELAKQVAAESRVDVAFKKIPREVLDKKAVEQGDVRFFELGALSVDAKQKGREVSLKLTDFVIPTDDIPDEARKAIKHWSQLIDYWAVDWDYKSDTFHNQWQTYRTRKAPKISLDVSYLYQQGGKYTILVKVIDILGNDTTKTLEVPVR